MASEEGSSSVPKRMASSSSPEYTAMRECYPHLINFVKETPSTITDALFAKGYISSTVRDSVRMDSKLPTDKARVLVDTVIDRVEFKPEIYHDFVEILKKEGPCAKDIIQDVQEMYQAKSNCASASSDPHSTVNNSDSTNVTGSPYSCLSPPGGNSLVHIDDESPRSTATPPVDNGYRYEVQDGFICPFCKKCSVDEFFSKKGCPQAVSDSIEQQNMFPYLNTEALSELDRQELEAKLLQDTEDMVCLFATIRSQIIGSFESRAKSGELEVKRVKDYVLSLGKLGSVNPKVLVTEDEAKIKESKSILDIFSTLLPYTSFFHYTILKLIVENFGSPGDHGRLEEYVTAFDLFCKRSVFEIPRSMFQHPLRERDEDLKVFSVKYSTEEIPTMGKIIRVRKRIARILDVSVWTLQLCSIEEGCVCLRFWIPSDVARVIFPVSKEKTLALIDIGIKVLDHREANSLKSLNLRELMLQLKDIVDVHTLGIHLGIPHSRLSVISVDFPDDINRQKSDMLNDWLENDPDKSWSKLIQALVLMDKCGIAQAIAQTFCPKYVFADLNPSVSDSKKKIHETISILETVKKIADELHETGPSRQIKRVIDVTTSGKVQMGLVGLTNSGKSTSLNALMGMDILPSSFQRQTVSTVCIKHKPTSSGKLYGKKTANEEPVALASGLKPVRTFISQLNDSVRSSNEILFSELILEAPICCLAGKDEVHLEIYDTLETSESSSSNVSTAWNLALNNLAVIVLVISADSLFDVSQDSLLENIKSLHPHMMEKQTRVLVLVNQYDKCFDGNKESWTLAQLHVRAAAHIKVSPEQVILFSARWALEARKWKQDPSSVNEDAYGEAYFFLRRTSEKDAIALLKPPHTCKSVRKLAEALERFSRIEVVEQRLLEKLCLNGPGILLENAMDVTLCEVSALKEATDRKVQAVNIETRQRCVAEQKKLAQNMNHIIEKHCKQNTATKVLNLVMQEFETHLNAVTSTLENQIVFAATGKVINLIGEFNDRNEILQRVIKIRNDLVGVSEGKVSEAWNGGFAEMKHKTTAQLRQVMQDIKQDILTGHLSSYLSFDSIDVSSLVSTLPFPTDQQPSFDQCQDISDTAINSLVVSRSVTKQRVENRTRKHGRRYGIAGPKKTTHYTEIVNYQVTIYEANINGLSSAFQRLAKFCVTHVQESLVTVLGELVNKLWQNLKERMQDVSEQPLERSQCELESRMLTMKQGDEEIRMLGEKSDKLSKIENELKRLL